MLVEFTVAASQELIPKLLGEMLFLPISRLESFVNIVALKSWYLRTDSRTINVGGKR